MGLNPITELQGKTDLVSVPGHIIKPPIFCGDMDASHEKTTVY